MSTSDSGVIDLFAIHKEEQARMSAAPSAPPPAVALDIGGGSLDADHELDEFATAQQRSRKRTKVIGGIIGGVAVVGILIAAITAGSSSEPTKTAAAAAAAPPPPPPAMTSTPTPPVAEPSSSSLPAPPATSKAKTEKPDYTPATAAAAYAASQGKRKAAPAKKSIGGGIKLQKVQSAGVSN
jgi:hypothetical protein